MRTPTNREQGITHSIMRGVEELGGLVYFVKQNEGIAYQGPHLTIEEMQKEIACFIEEKIKGTPIYEKLSCVGGRGRGVPYQIYRITIS